MNTEQHCKDQTEWTWHTSVLERSSDGSLTLVIVPLLLCGSHTVSGFKCSLKLKSILSHLLWFYSVWESCSQFRLIWKQTSLPNVFSVNGPWLKDGCPLESYSGSDSSLPYFFFFLLLKWVYSPISTFWLSITALIETMSLRKRLSQHHISENKPFPWRLHDSILSAGLFLFNHK